MPGRMTMYIIARHSDNGDGGYLDVVIGSLNRNNEK